MALKTLVLTLAAALLPTPVLSSGLLVGTVDPSSLPSSSQPIYLILPGPAPTTLPQALVARSSQLRIYWTAKLSTLPRWAQYARSIATRPLPPNIQLPPGTVVTAGWIFLPGLGFSSAPQLWATSWMVLDDAWE